MGAGAAVVKIANPGDYDTDSLFKMWWSHGSYESHSVYVWADSFDDAFEVLVEYLDDNAPGALTNIGVAELKEAAKDLGISWQKSWPNHDDEQFQKVVEHAEIDLTDWAHHAHPRAVH